MQLRTLAIRNFRAIEDAELNDLPGMVVVAGPNGCGKSCLFDAIRLVKSVYGGYQPNEWHQWFNEFQICLDLKLPGLLTLLQNRTQPLTVSIEVALSPGETEYIRENAGELLRPIVWQQLAPQTGLHRAPPLAAQLLEHGDEVNRRVEEGARAVLDDLGADSYQGRVSIGPNSSIEVKRSPVLELVFSVFEPQRIGIVEYHGAQRTYQREQVGSVNLSIDTNERQVSQQALYNYAGKYTNIKSEMASSYVRDLICKEVGVQDSGGASLIATLQELFETFFPGKHFLGPKPTADGRLLFPVSTDEGFEHDINDLSSGEKEVLYGYLRLHNLSPRDSIILIDEPELHLNPRLIRGLPQFYDRHLGSPLGNQIWLLTHSDALLREALADPAFAVFHMQAASSVRTDGNQLVRVRVDEELERAVVDLVGDLATYRPGAKVVILEGGGDSDFDLFMVNTLFPDLQREVNAVSGGNRQRVIELNEALRSAKAKGVVTATFYAIVDRDREQPTLTENDGIYHWPSYHIENYLLESTYLLAALKDALGPKCPFSSAAEIDRSLVACAESTLPSLVREDLDQYANKVLVSQINTRPDPNAAQLVVELRRVIDRSLERANEASSGLLSEAELTNRSRDLEEKLREELSSGNWRTNYRGRDVLKCFVGCYCSGIKYEVFRNLVISKMRDAGYKPDEMAYVIGRVLSAK